MYIYIYIDILISKYAYYSFNMNVIITQYTIVYNVHIEL